MSDNTLMKQRDIYIGTGLVYIAVLGMVILFSTYAKTTAARSLHDNMFSCVLAANMQFFESSNTGEYNIFMVKGTHLRTQWSTYKYTCCAITNELRLMIS